MKTAARGKPCAAVEGSPEFFLRRRAPGVHRLVVLVHGKQEGNISGMRKIARKLMEQVGGHRESCTRRNREGTVADVASPAGDWGGLGARWAWSWRGTRRGWAGGLIGRLGGGP